MKRLLAATFVLAIFGAATLAGADKPNPTGTWKWSVTMGGNTRDMTLKLKLDGDKLSGAMVGRDNKETAIEEPTYKDGEVKFKVTRERNGTKTTSTTREPSAAIRSRARFLPIVTGPPKAHDWEAKRAKD